MSHGIKMLAGLIGLTFCSCAADEGAVRHEGSGLSSSQSERAEAESACIELTAKELHDLLIQRAMPRLPRSLPRAGMNAEAQLKLVFSAEGNLVDFTFLKEFEPVTEAILEAVGTWRIRPYLVEGNPVPVCTVYKFIFRTE